MTLGDFFKQKSDKMPKSRFFYSPCKYTSKDLINLEKEDPLSRVPCVQELVTYFIYTNFILLILNESLLLGHTLLILKRRQSWTHSNYSTVCPGSSDPT